MKSTRMQESKKVHTTNNEVKDSKLTKLPESLQLHIMSFLNPKEIKKNSHLSKDFHQKTQKLISGIFYMVGKGIEIGNYSQSSAEEKLIQRRKISSNDIIVSFPKAGIVKLFETLEEAQIYARFLRTDPGLMHAHGDPFFQPAVFEVNFLNRSLPKFVTETFNTKPCLERINLLPNDHVTQNSLNCFETNVNNIEPLSGTMDVDFLDNEKIKQYGSVDWKIKLSKPSKCILM